MRQKRAQLQEDAKPLPIGRTVPKRRSFGLWPSHRHRDLAMQFGDYQLAAAHSNGKKWGRALTMAAPDPFDKRRVRRPFLINENHVSTSVSRLNPLPMIAQTLRLQKGDRSSAPLTPASWHGPRPVCSTLPGHSLILVTPWLYLRRTLMVPSWLSRLRRA